MKSRALRPPKPPLVQEFEEQSLTIFHSMKNRKVVVQRGGLTFDLRAFRAWLLVQLGGRPDTLVRCAYCTRWVIVAKVKPRANIFAASVDHKIPLAKPWYGSPGLENLTLCCIDCNIAKGRVSADGWLRLVEFLLTLDPRDRTDILNRLAHGNEGQLRAWERSRETRDQLRLT